MSACDTPVTEAGGGSPCHTLFFSSSGLSLPSASYSAGIWCESGGGGAFFWLKYCSKLIVVSADSIPLRLLLAVDPSNVLPVASTWHLAQQEPTSSATGRARLIVGAGLLAGEVLLLTVVSQPRGIRETCEGQAKRPSVEQDTLLPTWASRAL